MKRFVEGDDRKQVALLPECVDDYIGQENPVRVIDVFVDELDLEDLGFSGTTPALTGRPSYHPGVMLKIYIYGYLNRVPSSRRIERECQRNGSGGQQKTEAELARIHQCAPMRPATARSIRPTIAISPEESTAEATSAAQSCTVCP